MAAAVEWHGTHPTHCQLCGSAFADTFYDAKTFSGPWGLVCPDCFEQETYGIGLGRGQRYELIGGLWQKTAG